MPNPAPPPTKSDPLLTYTDDHLKDLHKKVADNLHQAGAKVPYEAVKPIHVPDEHAINIANQTHVNTERSIPESFKSTPETALSPLKAISEHLDYADQLVTGRSHVVDDANRFTAHKKEKEDKKLQFQNEPKKESKSPVKKLVDWLHD